MITCQGFNDDSCCAVRFPKCPVLALGLFVGAAVLYERARSWGLSRLSQSCRRAVRGESSATSQP